MYIVQRYEEAWDWQKTQVLGIAYNPSTLIAIVEEDARSTCPEVNLDWSQTPNGIITSFFF